MRNFLVSTKDVSGKTVTITGSDCHHIKNVLRLSTGEEIVANVEGTASFVCVIERIGKDEVLASIKEQLETATPSIRITLAQAIPKGRKMDDIVRMACELGVEKIVPVITERVVVNLDEKSAETKVDRWREIAKASAKQSRAVKVTEVAVPIHIEELRNTGADLSIVMWEGRSPTLKSILSEHEDANSITILIGSEGGLSDDEVGNLKDIGFKSASFGKKILRTETAGVAVASALLYHYG